ncbi:LDH2 family malate/lactate/ureidoglycolate dehydrogenase [Palleronia aestuarii]|uniref:LDH2 family malate/lactate/ureidoglycolate dehydrogenase n=1 Tax=Palleronia aestuarii TaxID=568105 RepID=A0A2W7NF12_9RHOB|nr:Ldh family oxidoreductase [Palleronia aestuarii]PZX18788.1 LDH2 family malate/lactate/ureidoglycolate dehydrogenase [Palleronia aestuarii]
MSDPASDHVAPPRVPLEEMERFAFEALDAVHADAETSEALVRALSHASIHGVDTHGYRLLPHYLAGFAGGRLNPRPTPRLVHQKGGAAVLDGDDAHGSRATYMATEEAVRRAREHGVGAVAIRNSSHFGAAGAYAIDIAQNGMMGFAFCNSDPFVRLHDGASRFHGTNPIAVAAPTGEGDPWLLDMATSAIPFNKVQLSQSLGIPLAAETASDAEGRNVTDPMAAEMLAPLGGAFGYKGAGLAGISELLSTALSDAPLSTEIAPMISDDMSTPRGLGAFVLALDPAAFAGAEVFFGIVRRYLESIRSSATRPGGTVLAAGDREWAEAERRRTKGITLDPTAVEAMADFARRNDLAPLALSNA